MLLDDLGLGLPVLAAPMAGGPGVPALVLAAAAADSLGFLAGGYKTAEALAAEMATVREVTPTFGVNLFAPNPLPVDRSAFAAFADRVRVLAEEHGFRIEITDPLEDDDLWADKLDLLVADPPPLVSFTFGIPAAAEVAALRRAGSLTVQTVTSADEAGPAAAAGVDALAVQAAGAGGHYGTLTPLAPPAPLPLPELVRSVRAAVDVPLIAAGGIGSAEEVAAALAAGAEAVAVGTALLRTDESGASATHRSALTDPSRGTVVTHAFTGRPARGLRNTFTERMGDDAPFGYPALHHLTSGLRRQSAAAGDPELVNLWAGTGYAQAMSGPAGDVLRELSRGA